MKHTSLALIAACSFAALAFAQTKAPPVKDLNASGFFPPPGGSSALVAGGSDDCAAAAGADAISGPGTYAVTTVGATNGLPDAGGCANTNLDVWFYWTAQCSGDATIASCGGVTADSVVTVWADGSPAGTCPTTSAACNDDFCGFQSSVTFAAVAGTSYFIQWGAFGGTTTYSGTFTISTCVPPAVVPPNDDCASPITIGGGGSFPFDNRLATTGTEGQGNANCLFFGTTGISKDSWWTWTPTLAGTATLTTCGTTTPVGADTKVAIYDGVGCPAAVAIACNDDDSTCAAGGLNSTVSWTTVCGQSYTIQLGQYPPNTGSFQGSFQITETGTSCCDEILPGSDLFFTPSTGNTVYLYSAVPIPAGLFGPGSDPLITPVNYIGDPLAGTGLTANADTIVKRTGTAAVASCPSSAAVPIEIVALSLVSASPVTVSFNGGTSSSLYSSRISLSSTTPQSVGSMVIRREHQQGGTWDSSFPVTTRLEFTKVSGVDGLGLVVIDPGPTHTFGVSGAPWACVDPGLGVLSSTGGVVDHDVNGATAPVAYPASSNFKVGVVYPGASCAVPGGTPYLAPIDHSSFTASHQTVITIIPPGNAYCFGDGSGTACPCGNVGAAGNGCGSSLFPSGANLSTSGLASVSSDSLVLIGSSMPNGPALYFQGTLRTSLVLGDGLRCVAGSVIRLGIEFNSSNASQYPAAGDPPISIKGMIPGANVVRDYQCWYRSAEPTFCTPATFNLTNAVELTWTP